MITYDEMQAFSMLFGRGDVVRNNDGTYAYTFTPTTSAATMTCWTPTREQAGDLFRERVIDRLKAAGFREVTD